ncbi:MAG: response regulator [Ignavibacteria bacterium]|nr:response regulator [Ignavibacteria bacterium]MBI3766503.1 response regulator [Ignavibacteriales bacterium]
MENNKIRILLVEDNKDFAKLVQVYLQRFEKDRFEVTWKENYAETMAELKSHQNNFDIILMDYFLPGKNGLEITRELLEKRFRIPVVFLTVNKDFDLALDVMKLGVDDYLVKEEISSPVLPKTVLNVVEKHRLKTQLAELEISQQRLKAIRDTLSGMVHDFEVPLREMKSLAVEFKERFESDELKNYTRIIDENVDRIMDKLEKLKTLKVDKTVRYIKDIKMLDLS